MVFNFKNIGDGKAGNSRSRFFIFAGVFLLIMFAAGGGYFVWDRYFSGAAQTQRNYQKYLDWQANYDKAMREDTYGGKTPQETLNMFVAALRAGDVELASRYFNLNSSLNQNKWTENIKKEIEKYIRIVSNAIPTPNQKLSKDIFWFSVYDNAGNVEQLIEMSFNPKSNVWKIESL